MQKVLLTWLGITDINSSIQESSGGLGPIAGAILARKCKQVHILSDFPKELTSRYKKWLENNTSVKAVVQSVTLEDAMDFGSIYDSAQQAASEIINTHKEENVAFAISPGTPAMASVWIILSKTLFPNVELIESSRQDSKGNYQVRTASVPFDISADRIVNMLLNPDEKLTQLMQGLPPGDIPQIIHQCPEMKRAIAMARHAAIRNVPVLLLGESGTGKELFARLICEESLRTKANIERNINQNARVAIKESFIAFNCGAFSPDLVESELFGHKKGAFTGASYDKKGLFVEADGKTLFLDEIGDLELNTQVKLLRAIQEKEIRPIGTDKPTKINVRIIAATHKNLMEEVAKGNFRSDLFYRLGVAVIQIPPLRQRGKDVDLLIDYFMQRINEEFAKQPNYKGPKQLSHTARIVLRNYQWPGNVRELENTLERAAMWTPGIKIEKQDILDSIITIKSQINSYILNQPLGTELKVKEVIDKVAKHYLTRALKESGGNKSRAAELVGLGSHQTFSAWMEKHGVV